MKTKRIRKYSARGLLLKECDSLFRKIILKERPNKCEHCWRTYKLQVAHILPKGSYPRMRYHRMNVLLMAFPCHPEWWHKNPLEAITWLDSYKEPNYRDTLLMLNKIQPKLTPFQLQLYISAFKQELERVCPIGEVENE